MVLTGVHTLIVRLCAIRPMIFNSRGKFAFSERETRIIGNYTSYN